MTNTDAPLLKITSPVDLLSATPYLLGFHPHESLVVIGVDDHAVILSARVDLDYLDSPAALLDMCTTIRRNAANGLIAIVYTDTDEISTLASVR